MQKAAASSLISTHAYIFEQETFVVQNVINVSSKEIDRKVREVLNSLSDQGSNTYVVLLGVAAQLGQPGEWTGFGFQHYIIGLETLDENITYAYAWQAERPRTAQATKERHARPFFVFTTRN